MHGQEPAAHVGPGPWPATISGAPPSPGVAPVEPLVPVEPLALFELPAAEAPALPVLLLPPALAAPELGAPPEAVAPPVVDTLFAASEPEHAPSAAKTPTNAAAARQVRRPTGERRELLITHPNRSVSAGPGST